MNTDQKPKEEDATDKTCKKMILQNLKGKLKLRMVVLYILYNKLYINIRKQNIVCILGRKISS